MTRGVIGTPGDVVVAHEDRMPGAEWFPEASLNFAQNLLERKRADDTSDALVFWGEEKLRRRMSHLELHALAARASAAFAAAGIAPGDRVAAYVPNIPEAVIAMLGADIPRRDLVVVLAGVRRAGRAGPLRPDRAQDPRHRRRLLLQRQGDPDPRQGCRHRGRPAVGGEGGRDSLSAANVRCVRPSRPRCAAPWRGMPGSRLSCPVPSTMSRCRSRTLSTSSIRRAPPACRSASCTRPAACCCSI